MGVFSQSARVLAGVIALAAWMGLLAQFLATLGLKGNLPETLWVLLRYFTVITNLILAVVFTGVAAGRRGFSEPTLLGGATLAILLVGVVYGLLLRDLVELSGGAKLADLLLHHLTPILAPLFWLAYAPKGNLQLRDPLVWVLFPLIYFIYALVRGLSGDLYAYPFMDAGHIGWLRTILNGLIMAAGFITVGYVAVWLDARLARRAGV